MDDKQPQFWEAVAIWFSSLVLWASGETGRMYVAGAAGGFTRAVFVTRTRRLVEWVIATIGGAISAKYLWPLVFQIIDFFVPGEMALDEDNKVMSAYVAGLAGLSLVRAILLLVEVWSNNARKREDGA